MAKVIQDKILQWKENVIKRLYEFSLQQWFERDSEDVQWVHQLEGIIKSMQTEIMEYEA